jgi:hypothetical protein
MDGPSKEMLISWYRHARRWRLLYWQARNMHTYRFYARYMHHYRRRIQRIELSAGR